MYYFLLKETAKNDLSFLFFSYTKYYVLNYTALNFAASFNIYNSF